MCQSCKCTVKRLKELIRYDPLTGVFSWLKTGKGRKLNRSAGSIRKSTGYLVICIDGVQYYAHRLAFLYMTGSIPEKVDHKDGNKINNRWLNLRACNQSLNMMNTKIRSNNTSGVKGVTWSKSAQKWQAQVVSDGNNHYCGLFDDIESATKAVCAMREKLHGNFANHG